MPLGESAFVSAFARPWRADKTLWARSCRSASCDTTTFFAEAFLYSIG